MLRRTDGLSDVIFANTIYEYILLLLLIRRIKSGERVEPLPPISVEFDFYTHVRQKKKKKKQSFMMGGKYNKTKTRDDKKREMSPRSRRGYRRRR